jgi:hypothetical protein
MLNTKHKAQSTKHKAAKKKNGSMSSAWLHSSAYTRKTKREGKKPHLIEMCFDPGV